MLQYFANLCSGKINIYVAKHCVKRVRIWGLSIPIHILPNISQSKGNLTIKFGQLIEYNKRNIFLQSHVENELGRLVPNLFLLFKKSFI